MSRPPDRRADGPKRPDAAGRADGPKRPDAAGRASGSERADPTDRARGRGRRATREVLARHGLRAHKDRGQNFLVDEAIAARIADYSECPPEASVVEIGPGLGILTRALARRAGRVVAIEVDRGLVAALRKEGGFPPNVELIHADALEVDLAALATRLPAPVYIVANLPYSISAPLLRWLLGARSALVSWVVMLQREVAERLLAPVGSRAYGSLTALYRAVGATERMGPVPNAAFDPVPQVESLVVRTTPTRPDPLHPGELEALEALLRAAFHARRKTLSNSLRGAWPWGDVPARDALAEALAAAEIAEDARAEVVSPEQFVTLLRSLRGSQPR